MTILLVPSSSTGMEYDRGLQGLILESKPHFLAMITGSISYSRLKHELNQPDHQCTHLDLLHVVEVSLGCLNYHLRAVLGSPTLFCIFSSRF